MYLFLFTANVGVLGSAVIIGYLRRRLYTFLLGALLVLELASLLKLSADIEAYSASVVKQGQALFLLGSVVLVAAILLSERLDLAGRTVARTPLALPSPLTRRYLALCATSLLIILAVRFRAGFSGGLTTWQDRRSQAGTADAITNILGFFIVPSPLVLWRAGRRTLAVALAPMVLVYLQLAGSRAMALTIPAALVLIIMRSGVKPRSTLLKIGVLGIAAMLGFSGFRVVRNVSVTELPSELGTALSTPGNDITGGESRILGSLYYLVATDRHDYPYRAATTPQRLAFIYLPRSNNLVPKPLDITYEIWNDYLDDGYMDRDRFLLETRDLADSGNPGSDHPTLWGDALANLGVIGIALYALVIGLGVFIVDLVVLRLSSVLQLLVLPVLAVTYFFLARGNVVIGIGYIAYGVPVVACLAVASRLRLFGDDLERPRPAAQPAA